MNELALFAGAGGGILGGQILGWRTICAVELEPYAASVLCARQNEGFLPPFPIWSDICTFDGHHWRGRVDVVSGGFPCQDISVAGSGAGLDGERSGLWREMFRVIGEVRPRFVFVENSSALVSRGLGRVLADLTRLGYDARWGIVSAASIGAPHTRKRIWIRATDTRGKRWDDGRGDREERQVLPDRIGSPPQSESKRAQLKRGVGASCADVANADCDGWERQRQDGCEQGQVGLRGRARADQEQNIFQAKFAGVWEVEPSIQRVVDGMANRVERLKAIGNGQVPAVAAAAWHLLA